jgi:hypothetical protein
MKSLTLRTKVDQQKEVEITVRERLFDANNCSDFQNVKGANLMIDPLTY